IPITIPSTSWATERSSPPPSTLANDTRERDHPGPRRGRVPPADTALGQRPELRRLGDRGRRRRLALGHVGDPPERRGEGLGAPQPGAPRADGGEKPRAGRG